MTETDMDPHVQEYGENQGDVHDGLRERAREHEIYGGQQECGSGNK